jgi:nucleoside-diphosphate-sugar epimerase
MSEPITVICGAGGFIGGHLAARLSERGLPLRVVDVKPVGAWHRPPPAGADVRQADLRDRTACRDALRGAGRVFNLAADMGGMGYIDSHKTACMLNVLINTHLLMAANELGVERYFFASSACVYAAQHQQRPDLQPLSEEAAYPAMPEDGYGWEKLFSERLCRHYAEEHGLTTRVARYHNVYGPHETYRGGREKAPAAICRKVAEAKLTGRTEIEIWGDGEQTRSFTYIDDCLHGTELVMHGAFAEPVNVGSSEMVTINQLVTIVEEIAGVRLTRRYNPQAPCGVRGRNSDNTLIRSRYGWAPGTPLQDGLARLYRWVHDQLVAGR